MAPLCSGRDEVQLRWPVNTIDGSQTTLDKLQRRSMPRSFDRGGNRLIGGKRAGHVSGLEAGSALSAALVGALARVMDRTPFLSAEPVVWHLVEVSLLMNRMGVATAGDLAGSAWRTVAIIDPSGPTAGPGCTVMTMRQTRGANPRENDIEWHRAVISVRMEQAATTELLISGGTSKSLLIGAVDVWRRVKCVRSAAPLGPRCAAGRNDRLRLLGADEGICAVGVVASGIAEDRLDLRRGGQCRRL